MKRFRLLPLQFKTTPRTDVLFPEVMQKANPNHMEQRHLPELVCRIDPRGRLTYINPRSFLAAPDRKGSNLLGRPFHSALSSKAGRGAWAQALQAVMAEARPIQIDLNYRELRCARRFRCFFLPEFNGTGEVAGVTVIAAPAAEAQTTADAESQPVTKSTFMSHISHELRTPLAGMMNLIELIGENPQRNCTAENISLILEAGQELKSMISTLLEALQDQSGSGMINLRGAASKNTSSGESILDALSHLGPLHVLIVEDNYINLLAFRQTLEQSGFRVQEAMNGEEALACLEREPFDLVLMDVRMPVMDGLEATRRIRASRRRRLRETKVIALTGYTLADDRQRIMEAGADGIISKPIDTEDLTRALQGLFPSSP